MDEYNNQDRNFFNQRRYDDNPYTKYDRAPGEKPGYIDPAKPLQSFQNRQPTYNQPIQRQQFQMPQPPFVPQQPIMPMGQMQIPPQPIQMGQPQPMPISQPQPAPYNMQPNPVQMQDYDSQYEYQQRQQYAAQQRQSSQKKKGFFANLWGKGKTQEPVQQPLFNSKNVIMQTPVRIDDLRVVIDMLKDGNTLIVDFSKASDRDCQRMIDYISGAIYALGGVYKSIGDKKFLYTPEGTGISGQLS